MDRRTCDELNQRLGGTFALEDVIAAFRGVAALERERQARA